MPNGGGQSWQASDVPQIVQDLCEIVEKQNIIIRRQAEALAQLDAVCMEEQIREVNARAEEYLGTNEG